MAQLELQKMPVDPDGDWVVPAARLIRREMFRGNEPTDPEMTWVAHPDHAITQYCLWSAGSLVAFARLSSRSSIGRPQTGAYELKHIVVSREHQRQGVGSYVLRCMEREAALAGASALDVHPIESARKFYQTQPYTVHPWQHSSFTRRLASADGALPVPLLELQGGALYPPPVVEQVRLSAKLFDNRDAYL